MRKEAAIICIAGHVDSAADRWLLRLAESVAEYYASRGCIIRVFGRGELAKAAALGAEIGWMSSPQPPPTCHEYVRPHHEYVRPQPPPTCQQHEYVRPQHEPQLMLAGASALVWLGGGSPYILHAAERCGLQVIRVSWH
jgi:hypothetical protein